LRWLWLTWLHRQENDRTEEFCQFLYYSLVAVTSPSAAYEQSLEQVNQILRSIQATHRPWDAENIRTGGIASVAELFHAEYGYPGEEKYEKMLQEQAAALEKIRQDVAASAAQRAQEQADYAALMRDLQKI